jgi:site-specific recombinase XerD
MVLKWEVILKVSGWASEYVAVSKLFRYLEFRKTGSEASRKIYGFALSMFCQFTRRTPDELVTMSKKEIEEALEEFGYKKRERCCPRTVNVLLCDILTFFQVNTFRGENALHIELFHQPAGARTRPEYVPSLEEALMMAECAKTLRDKAMVLLMVFSGLRNSTLRALRYGDIREELAHGKDVILIRVYVDMKKLVPASCKGKIEYFTFACKKATDVIKLYVAQKLDRIGEILEQDPLFSCEYNQLSFKDRSCKPVSDRQLQVITKQAAKDAKIKDWKHVTPHALRKVYETLLRSQLRDGSRLDIQEQIFLMGHHTQPGDLGPYFVPKVEDMRRKYSKLIFDPRDEKLSKALEVLKAAGEALRFYGASSSSSDTEKFTSLNSIEAANAIQDFVREIQRTDDTGSKAPAGSTSVSQRKGQFRKASSNDPLTQALAKSDIKQERPDSNSEILHISIRKSTDQSENSRHHATKQTALETFTDLSVRRGSPN